MLQCLNCQPTLRTSPPTHSYRLLNAIRSARHSGQSLKWQRNGTNRRSWRHRCRSASFSKDNQIHLLHTRTTTSSCATSEIHMGCIPILQHTTEAQWMAVLSAEGSSSARHLLRWVLVEAETWEYVSHSDAVSLRGKDCEAIIKILQQLKKRMKRIDGCALSSSISSAFVALLFGADSWKSFSFVTKTKIKQHEISICMGLQGSG